MTQPIRFHINDKPVQADAGDADMALIDFLHERQDLTGTKFCCGIGVCRACTVATREGGDEVLEKTLSCSTPVRSWRSCRKSIRVMSASPASACTGLSLM